jgi:tetratricopeptide (TPR) repeat protein
MGTLYVSFLMKNNMVLQIKNATLYPLVIVLLLFSIKTWSRNYDWKDNYTLYAHDINLVPNSVKAHYYLGLELVKVVADKEENPEARKKIYEQGIAELEKAVNILPTFTSAYTQMGVAYYRMKNYEKAIENYNKSAMLNPHDAITLNNIGTVYFEWKKYPEAKEKFEQALKIDGRFIDAHMNLGSVLGTMGDLNGAVNSFKNAIHYAPDNANAHYFLAITYSNMKDTQNADKHFRRAEQLNPKLKRPTQ